MEQQGDLASAPGERSWLLTSLCKGHQEPTFNLEQKQRESTLFGRSTSGNKANTTHRPKGDELDPMTFKGPFQPNDSTIQQEQAQPIHVATSSTVTHRLRAAAEPHLPRSAPPPPGCAA